MGAILFSADLDSKKLEAAIKESNKTVGEWVKGVEKAGGTIDKVFEHTKESIKKTIAEQKILIKSIEQDVKDLQKLYDEAAPGRVKSGRGAEVGMAKRALTEARGELSGLQEKQIELNNKEAESDDKIVLSKNKIVEALKKWGLGLFSIGAALKIMKDIVNSTEGAADKFEATIGLLKGGIAGLYRTMVTGSWDQLISNIVNAAKATRDLKEATSELEHITAGGKIKRADLRGSMEKARVNAAEATDPAERARFLNEAIDYQKQITELNVGEIKKRLKIDEDYYFKLTGHSQEYYDYLLTQIPSIAKDYEGFYSRQEGYQIRLNQLKYKETAQFKGLSIEQAKEKDQLEKALFVLEDFKILQEDLSKKGQWDEYISGIGEMREAIATGEQALVYLTRQTTTANDKASKAFGKSAEEAEKEAIEAAKLENKISKEKELLNEAIDKGDEVQAKAIAARISELERELAVRERLAAAMIKNAGNESSIPTIINASSLKIPSLSSPKKGFTESGLAINSLASPESVLSVEKEISQVTRQIVQNASDLVFQLGVQLGLSENELDVLNDSLTAIGQIAQGKGLQAMITMATSVVSELIKLLPNKAAEFQAQIESINRVLEIQQRLIDQSARTGGEEDARRKALASLELLRSTQMLQLAQAEYKLRHASILNEDKRAQRVDDLTKSVEDSDYAILQANQDLDDFLTGGETSNTVANAIAQGFQEGKTSVDDFGEYMNQVLLDKVLNIFKSQFLLPMIDKELTPVIMEAIQNDTVISDTEKANIDRITKEIADKNKATWEGLTGALDLGGPTSNNGLSGGIQRSITESTGTELAGLFRRFADDNRVTKDYTLMGVQNLTKIEANTFQTVVQLQLAVTELQSINKNTREVNVGVK